LSFTKVGTRNYAFKTQFKEWFDHISMRLATSAALLGSQFSRIFSGLTTAYNYICRVFCLYSVIIGMAYCNPPKEQSNTTKTTQGGADDYLVLLEFGYPAVLDILFIRFVCIGCSIFTGNALTGYIAGKYC
jgi:hypothetical protein